MSLLLTTRQGGCRLIDQDSGARSGSRGVRTGAFFLGSRCFWYGFGGSKCGVSLGFIGGGCVEMALGLSLCLSAWSTEWSMGAGSCWKCMAGSGAIGLAGLVRWGVGLCILRGPREREIWSHSFLHLAGCFDIRPFRPHFRGQDVLRVNSLPQKTFGVELGN